MWRGWEGVKGMAREGVDRKGVGRDGVERVGERRGRKGWEERGFLVVCDRDNQKDEGA